MNATQLDTLFFATPPGNPLQPIGRLREVAREGKKELLVIDPWETNPYALDRAKARRSLSKEDEKLLAALLNRTSLRGLYLAGQSVLAPGILGTILLVVLVLVRLGLVMAASLNQTFPHLPFSALRAALPVPLGGVLLTVLFNVRLAFAGSLSLTILTGLMLDAPIQYFMLAFVGSLVGIFALVHRHERTAFFRATVTEELGAIETVRITDNVITPPETFDAAVGS